MKQTEAHCRAAPGFMPVEEREKEMAEKMGVEIALAQGSFDGRDIIWS
jgi:hypothetical protein